MGQTWTKSVLPVVMFGLNKMNPGVNFLLMEVNLNLGMHQSETGKRHSRGKLLFSPLCLSPRCLCRQQTKNIESGPAFSFFSPMLPKFLPGV